MTFYIITDGHVVYTTEEVNDAISFFMSKKKKQTHIFDDKENTELIMDEDAGKNLK